MWTVVPALFTLAIRTVLDRDIENPEQLIAPQKQEVADSVIWDGVQ